MSPPKLSRKVRRYAASLAAAGVEDREIARAAFYAQAYGLKALAAGTHCSEFAKPACDTGWDCLNPAHQRLEIVEGP